MREMIDSLERHIGKTVTIFTTSGGISGSGFTGVLACVGGGVVRLITAIGAAPACPVGSNCVDNWNFNGCGGGCDNGFGNVFGGGGWSGSWGGGFGGGCMGPSNWLGAVAEIPLDKIVTFTHNALT